MDEPKCIKLSSSTMYDVNAFYITKGKILSEEMLTEGTQKPLIKTEVGNGSIFVKP